MDEITLTQVGAGEVSPPETTEALIAILPDINWPAQED